MQRLDKIKEEQREARARARGQVDTAVMRQTPTFVRDSGLPQIPIEFLIAGRILAVSIEKAKIIHQQLSEILKKYEGA